MVERRIMENRPAPLRSRRVCRFCLTDSEPLSFIYERDHSKPFQVPLTLQIMSCVAIEVYAADGMPQMICNMCRWNLDRSYKFKLQCKKADEALRAYPLSGVLPRPFPPIATDPPESTNKRSYEKSQNEMTKRQRLDNDDKEKRETRDRERERDRDRDREKDRDKERQSDMGRDKDHQDELYEEEQDGGSEPDQESSKDDRKLEPGEIRVHACDQCDRTFPLRQALALHIQRAHRDRNYKCTECDRMFFSKYDLGKHMATHSEEKPYTCAVCQKQFSRPTLLQRHEKVHRDELRYGCQHCDREFFTTEELEKHEDAMHKKEKPFQCNICNKRFTYKQGLERHEVLHNEDKTFVCEYCKEAFRTSTKLARHLATHAGHRPYLCKLCPRTFLLSHHLTRHMRTHSVEKRHVCEDCGKAFKRKESLEVHQLTHTKRSGMGLTCDVCQESCRNRADYVTHIKQHIEAGEKMGPDGLQPDPKKIDLDSEDEEDEEQYSDGDDDYEPPAYIVKKLPKGKPSESEEDEDGEKPEKEEPKEQVVYLKGKDGNLMKKTVKTLMPIQRKDIQDVKKQNPNNNQLHSSPKASQSKQIEDNSKTSRGDDTEAQVQKIVASVFKEHKIPLKHQNATEEPPKESGSMLQGRAQVQHSAQSQGLVKEEKSDSTPNSTPKAINTVKVIKRIVVRKPSVTSDTLLNTPTHKESESATSSQPSVSGSGAKVTKRVIVRRIIRQGDTTREVIMNPDGTIIDPSELAKLPTGNVVKRVVVKKPIDKSSQGIVQTVLQSSSDPRKSPISKTTDNGVDAKASQVTTVASATPKVAPPITQISSTLTKETQETKEKLEQLEKRVEQQRLKIEELQARKQQEYDVMDEMLPERHDESEDEQQLPLKRVFVKRKQSIYDEEQEYTDTDVQPTATIIAIKKETPVSVTEVQDENEVSTPSVSRPVEKLPKSVTQTVKPVATTPVATGKKERPLITSAKLFGNKKIIVVKTEETSEVEEMSRELCNILDSADTVAKMQETVLSNLTQISSIEETPQKSFIEKQKDISSLEADLIHQDEAPKDIEEKEEEPANQKHDEETPMNVEDERISECKTELLSQEAVIEHSKHEESSLVLNEPDLSESTDIFEASGNMLEVQKSEELGDSVIELDHGNHAISLNDTNDSQDSLEDKLSQMEG